MRKSMFLPALMLSFAVTGGACVNAPARASDGPVYHASPLPGAGGAGEGAAAGAIVVPLETGAEGDAGPAATAPAPVCDYLDWVGKKVDEAQVRQTGRPFRILKPGSVMTMDYSPNRLNVIVDDAGIVLEVRCG